jgi:hypothetical protein
MKVRVSGISVLVLGLVIGFSGHSSYAQQLANCLFLWDETGQLAYDGYCLMNLARGSYALDAATPVVFGGPFSKFRNNEEASSGELVKYRIIPVFQFGGVVWIRPVGPAPVLIVEKPGRRIQLPDKVEVRFKILWIDADLEKDVNQADANLLDSLKIKFNDRLFNLAGEGNGVSYSLHFEPVN